MKYKGIILTMALMGLCFSSCMIKKTIPIQEDPNIPEDQLAIVENHSPRFLHIKRIDDKEFETTFGKVYGRTLTVIDIYRYTLLPGSHTIEAFIYGSGSDPVNGSVTYKSSPVHMTFDVDKGGVYVLRYETSDPGLYGTFTWDLLIKDKASGVVISTASDTRLEELTKELAHDSLEVRINAVEILSADDDPRVIEPLIIALNDKEYKIRMIAVSALTEIGDQAAVLPIKDLNQKAIGEEKILTTASLAVLGERDIDTTLIFQGLTSEEHLIRAASVTALGHLKDKKAVESLIEMASDPAYEVRKSVAWSLGEIGDERAIESLKQLRRDKIIGVSAAAKAALRKFK